MDPAQIRSHQTRSHSICGQEFQSNGNYMRLKQSLYSQQAAYDQNAGFNQRLPAQVHQNPSLHVHQHMAGSMNRAASPLGLRCGTASLTSREFEHYRSLDRQSRNHLHASLECLNTNPSDYQQHQPRQLQQQQPYELQQQQLQQQQQHQQQQQQQPQPHQQHQQHQLYQHRRASSQSQHPRYATGYVLAPPPANTIINQNGDQDLAAAAMESPSTHYQPHIVSHTPNSGLYTSQTQSLVNRAMAHVSQSPLRRLGLNGSSGSSIVSHLSNLNHPIRAGHSTISLASSSYLIEDKLQNEIKKLQEELNSEREKNEALTSQLNINSSLMAAFEQSLTTLNTRLRQLTTLNEKKDSEIEDLRDHVQRLKHEENHNQDGTNTFENSSKHEDDDLDTNCDSDSLGEQNLRKQIEDLKRQLVEKDRLLTDTRLEALSAAHQLEQLESKLNGDHQGMNNNDEDLDEGVMVVNHSPSDSDAVTDSHFSEVNIQTGRVQLDTGSERPSSRTPTYNIGSQKKGNNNNCHTDIRDSLENYNLQTVSENGTRQTNYSECQSEFRLKEIDSLSESLSQQFDVRDSLSREGTFTGPILSPHEVVQIP